MLIKYNEAYPPKSLLPHQLFEFAAGFTDRLIISDKLDWWLLTFSTAPKSWRKNLLVSEAANVKTFFTSR